MRGIKIYAKISCGGVMIFPFCVLNKRLKNYKHSEAITYNHENIHFAQAVETLVVGFYLIYAIEYLIRRLRGQGHDYAYRNLIFEREAFGNAQNLGYLDKRKPYAWLNIAIRDSR